MSRLLPNSEIFYKQVMLYRNRPEDDI